MAGHVTVQLTILVGGKPCPAGWRLRLFGFLARRLRVPFTVVKDG